MRGYHVIDSARKSLFLLIEKTTTHKEKEREKDREKEKERKRKEKVGLSFEI